MEDIKQFNELLVRRDKTILGAASNLLKALKTRWPERASVFDEMSSYLLELRAKLGEEGWKGYIPKPPVPIAEIAIDDTLELVAAQEAEKLIAERIARKKAADEVEQALALEKAEKKAALEAQIAELEELS